MFDNQATRANLVNLYNVRFIYSLILLWILIFTWKMIRQIEVVSPVLGDKLKQIHELFMKIVSFYCAEKNLSLRNKKIPFHLGIPGRAIADDLWRNTNPGIGENHGENSKLNISKNRSRDHGCGLPTNLWRRNSDQRTGSTKGIHFTWISLEFRSKLLHYDGKKKID